MVAFLDDWKPFFSLSKKAVTRLYSFVNQQVVNALQKQEEEEQE